MVWLDLKFGYCGLKFAVEFEKLIGQGLLRTRSCGVQNNSLVLVCNNSISDNSII